MTVLSGKWPVLDRHARAAEWLQIWSDLGRAPRTIDAYARGLGEFLLVCERDGIAPDTANRSHIAAFVRELRTRSSRGGANVLAMDSGAGPANLIFNLCGGALALLASSFVVSLCPFCGLCGRRGGVRGGCSCGREVGLGRGGRVSVLRSGRGSSGGGV